MKSWLYYAIGAGILSGVGIIWKYRYKLLRATHEVVKHENYILKAIRKFNKWANERKHERDKKRDEIFDPKNNSDSDPDDKWSELRGRNKDL